MTYGVPPFPRPWPDDPKLDPDLLAQGDARNVEDKYRYWRVEAIRDDMRTSSTGLEIAVENLERDYNLGTIVRNANAFNVARVHIIGRRQWNKRGAMKTDAYLDIVYHTTIEAFRAETRGKPLVAIDNVGVTTPLQAAELPRDCVLVFGSESDGLSDKMLAYTTMKVSIPQFGSTRSINVGVASGILMYKWVEQHILLKNSTSV